MRAHRLPIAAIVVVVAAAACGGSTPSAEPAGPTGPSSTVAGSSSATSAPTSAPGAAATPLSVPLPVRTPIPSSMAAPTQQPAATPVAPPASAAPIDVCGLFTGDELATLTGHKLLSTIPGPQFVDPYGCEWDFETPDVGIDWTISIGVWPNVPRMDFEGGKAFAIGTPLPGVGDDAYLTGSDSITALSGETEIDVQYVNLSDDPGIDQVPITVAQDVVQRLPH